MSQCCPSVQWGSVLIAEAKKKIVIAQKMPPRGIIKGMGDRSQILHEGKSEHVSRCRREIRLFPSVPPTIFSHPNLHWASRLEESTPGMRISDLCGIWRKREAHLHCYWALESASVSGSSKWTLIVKDANAHSGKLVLADSSLVEGPAPESRDSLERIMELQRSLIKKNEHHWLERSGTSIPSSRNNLCETSIRKAHGLFRGRCGGCQDQVHFVDSD